MTDKDTPIVSTEALTVVEAQARAEIDVAVKTAKEYPRSIERFREESLHLATLNEDVAGACFYAMPRDGKTIEGPSVRLAEIVMSCWGNCRAGARVIEVGDKRLTAQAVFRDLERNTIVTFEVDRRITYRNGGRYSDDMIVVTGNAACKIAYRNAVFTGIPQVFWSDVYQAARRAAIGDSQTLEQKVTKMIKYFGQMGKREADILELLGLDSIDEIDDEHLILMKGTGNAIRDSEISVEEAFGKAPDDRTADAPRTRVSAKDLNEKAAPAKRSSGRNKKAAPKPEPEPADDGEAPWSENGDGEDEPVSARLSPSPDENGQAEPESKDDTAAVKRTKIQDATYWRVKEVAMDAGLSPSKLTAMISDRFHRPLDKISEEEALAFLEELAE